MGACFCTGACRVTGICPNSNTAVPWHGYTCSECSRFGQDSCPYHSKYRFQQQPQIVIQTGWECPRCHAVMAPGMPTCVNCTGEKVEVSTDSSSKEGS